MKKTPLFNQNDSEELEELEEDQELKELGDEELEGVEKPTIADGEDDLEIESEDEKTETTLSLSS